MKNSIVYQLRISAVKTATLAAALTLTGLFLLVPRALAGSVSFSTGDPDGNIGTLSRIASAGKI